MQVKITPKMVEAGQRTRRPSQERGHHEGTGLPGLESHGCGVSAD